MKLPPPHILVLMAVAAELRASGASWAMIATKVQRDERTCRRWMESYPDAWQRLFVEAADRVLSEAGSESLHILRQLSRSKDDWLAQNTSKFLYHQFRAALALMAKRAPDSLKRNWAELIAYVETLTDDEAKTFVEDFVARRLAQPAPAVPADAAAPGPPVAG